MALANFFDKAALAASEVLQDFDRTAFEEFLTTHTVGLAFDAEASSSFEGRATLDLTANLLARLYPKIAIVPLGRGFEGLPESLAAACRAINPQIEITSELIGVSTCIVVGARKIDDDCRPVYIGSDGWLVRVSSEQPVGSGTGIGNPFGAAAAACFGAANIFRILFSAQLPHGGSDRNFALSLIDFETNAVHPKNPQLPEVVDIGNAHLVGLGAIGNGALWALARLRAARGILNVIDDEAVELTNLQRYVLTTQEDLEESKVAVAAAALSNSELTVNQHQDKWGDYLRKRNDWQLDRVAVALDTREDRIEVQSGLPRWICNAWTQADDLGVSRHGFLGNEACLACLYLPTRKLPSKDELVAQSLKMPEAVNEIRTILYHGTPVGRPFLERVATAMAVPIEPLLAFAEKPLWAFYSEAVCGGILLKLGAQGSKAATPIPMAFQSALAGVLLAAELVAEATSLKGPPPPTVTRINLLRPLGDYLTRPDVKRADGRCLCQDPDYISAYRDKYPHIA